MPSLDHQSVVGSRRLSACRFSPVGDMWSRPPATSGHGPSSHPKGDQVQGRTTTGFDPALHRNTQSRIFLGIDLGDEWSMGSLPSVTPTTQAGDHAIVGGAAVGPLTKKRLATDVADSLGVPPPTVSFGSSVASEFVGGVFTALTGDQLQETVVYRRTERLMQALDLTYEPFWDTSEHRAETGGGTVTNRAFSRIRTAVTGQPRCFILKCTGEAKEPSPRAMARPKSATAKPSTNSPRGGETSTRMKSSRSASAMAFGCSQRREIWTLVRSSREG